MISARIRAIVERIPEGTKVIADAACDHAYISIDALRCLRAEFSYACDINAAPLARARENIEFFGYAKRIATRLSDGLLGLLPKEIERIDTVVLAGIGGWLTIGIILDAFDMFDMKDKQFVISAQSDLPELRRFLHKIGLKIDDEIMIFDEKYYNIMNVSKGIQEFTDLEYEFGKNLIDKKDRVFIECIEKKIKKFENFGDSPKVIERIEKLKCLL
ncbi:hypothetical protein AGMMS49975_12790 [Clostridia bacterium]|nr:hypothetical protein AGMMS49975_12790 [Clostridia bacterium]